MKSKKIRHSTATKVKVALAAIKEELTQAQITSKYQIHTTQVRNWKQSALDAIQNAFTKKQERDSVEQEALLAKLYEQIGRLQTELNWLKKKCYLID
jgi:hypothetical protein